MRSRYEILLEIGVLADLKRTRKGSANNVLGSRKQTTDLGSPCRNDAASTGHWEWGLVDKRMGIIPFVPTNGGG